MTDTRSQTEAICEVVKITEVLVHDNADKLEIIHFDTASGPTAYTVVSQKGQWHAGDLAVYCGVDCVVPLEGAHSARWQWLKERPDGANKITFRIRAARLRGVYSEGVLSPCDLTDKLGDEKWDDWGIEYYSKPLRSNSANGKLGNIQFKAPKRLVFPEYGVTNLRKEPRLFEDGEGVVITEKIHGTNARFGWVQTGLLQWDYVVGSHRSIKTDHRPWYKKLWDRLRGNLVQSSSWYKEDLWLAASTKYGLKEILKKNKGLIIYGEIYGKTPTGKNIQDLDYGAPELGFRVFDIYDTRSKSWYSPLDVFHFCVDNDLEEVPRLTFENRSWVHEFSLDAVKLLAEGNSAMPNSSHVREGVVVKSLDGKKRGKWVGEGYRLRKSAEKEQVDEG